MPINVKFPHSTRLFMFSSNYPTTGPIKVLLFFCFVFILRLSCLSFGLTAEILSLNNLNVIAQLSSTLKFCPELTMFC